MNIMVYDVAAESGGAISILQYFYQQHKKDKTNHYFYMLSTYQMDNTDNITVINVPWVKKSWKNRLLFDYFGVKKYLKEFQIDEVLSLQNTIIPSFKGKQTVYEHNALPFSDYRYSIFEDKIMWIYQNVIGKFILLSIKKADRIIVQTEWMKKAISKKIKGVEVKTYVMFPQVEIPTGYEYHQPEKCIFFYPANASDFKNHKVIIKAAMYLKKMDIHDYSIVFTLKGDETEAIKKMYEQMKREQIEVKWLGQLTRENVFEWYSKSTLLFPSYIETVGLPIYEALMVGCPALISDCDYAKNVAKGFLNVKYFHYNDEKKLAHYMKQEIEKFK